ncbi:MAG: hypothetical protein ACP5HQ_03175 [Thermoprotei archaeon]
MVCIRYVDGVKDCYMIVLMNREFKVKAVTDPNSVLWVLSMWSRPTETTAALRAEARLRATGRVSRDALIRKLSGLD